MRTLRDLAGLPERPIVITVGAFDGLHRGHQRVVGATVREARQRDALATVISFEPHPDAVLRGTPPPLLCDPAECAARLAAAGVDLLVRQHFDAAFAAQTAETFVRRLAGNGGRLRALVLTPESAFGRGREGNARTLGPLAVELGFAIVEVAPLQVGGQRVSDSRIRELIVKGRLAAAGRLLGRRFALIGRVAHGDGRGQALGFPTANLVFPAPVALPPDGIYAVRTSWGGRDPLRARHHAPGVASLGVRPTFGGGERVLEVHLFDVQADLYGERLRVEFVRRQRGERRFGTVAALIGQMDRDAVRAREILARNE
ncbi:MAG: riboflavin biosynthesis protein RibF [Candidatus Limnocylindrales bacterium]